MTSAFNGGIVTSDFDPQEDARNAHNCICECADG